MHCVHTGNSVKQRLFGHDFINLQVRVFSRALSVIGPLLPLLPLGPEWWEWWASFIPCIGDEIIRPLLKHGELHMGEMGEVVGGGSR